MTPTQRSLALLRGRGWTCAVTEQWNPHAKVRQDLFGFCDLLAVREGALAFTERFCDGDRGGVLAVQTTTGDHLADRRAKILAEPNARTWLAAGGRIVLHGWRKVRPERGPCRRCDGRGIILRRGGSSAKCPRCRGTGRGSCPRTWRWECREEEVRMADFLEAPS